MEGSILTVNNTGKITNPNKTALIFENFARLKRRISKTFMGTLLNRKFRIFFEYFEV